MYKRFGLILILIAAAMMALAACGGGVQADVFPDIEIPAATTPRPMPPIPTLPPEDEPAESPPPGHMLSELTGLYIREEIANQRPFAVVINNENQALPQSGLMQADIIYEVLAEGSITRLVAIFQDFDAEMIGPVRSTREYFTYFALDHGAIMAHHGGSITGYNAISNRGIPAVDGMRYDGTVFWRDAERRRTRGLEHSSYTSAQNLLDISVQRGFDMAARENLGLFAFYDELTQPAPDNLANIVTVPFHPNHATSFEYNPDTNLYYKFLGNGAPHMDAATDEQLTVANVLIQITNMRVIDAEGRRDVTIVGGGDGFLATNGTYSRVHWQRDNVAGPTRWYDENGRQLTVNRGRTWISVINNEPIFE